MPEHTTNNNKHNPVKTNATLVSRKAGENTKQTKQTKQTNQSKQTKQSIKQKAGSSDTADICSKDINQLLMGNPPVSIGGKDLEATWKDTKRTAKDLDTYGKKGWGNYPGMPPQPDCVIL